MPLWLGIFTALAVLVGFRPNAASIKQVSALKVLQRADTPPPAAWLVVGVAGIVFGGLLWLYSAASLWIGRLALLALLWGVSLMAEWFASRCAALNGGEWVQAFRPGGRQLARRKRAGLGQLLAFSVTFCHGDDRPGA